MEGPGAGERGRSGSSRGRPWYDLLGSNWRKDGLQDRRNQLLKEYQFYNQLYCGCEFSLASSKAMEREAEKEKKEEMEKE